MSKKWWAVIGLALNLLVLIFNFLWQEDIFLMILLCLGIIFSVILFFKESKLLKLLAILLPLLVITVLIRGIFSSGTESVTDINDSVRDQINNLFNHS